MDWKIAISDYKTFLQLEKSLSANSVSAYLKDIVKFKQFLDYFKYDLNPKQIQSKHITEFINWINQLGQAPRTQARTISGLKSFFKYLMLEDIIEEDPTELIETPRIGRKLPDVLSILEIDQLIAAIDLSHETGQRNKAMIETLYSCGLRVSELINLKLSNVFFSEKFIKVQGKGNKERLVPISNKALKEIKLYINFHRNKVNVQKDSEDFVFLNRRGKKLTRTMVFTIIKDLAKTASIKKSISPHTFRHSFASHLVDGGADLRAVQEMLGHESILTTEIYTHLDKDYIRNTILQYHPRS